MSSSKQVAQAIQALRELVSLIRPEDELLDVAAAEEQMEATETRRRKELEAAHVKLKAATKTLETARASSTRPKTIPSTQEHIARMNKLADQKLALAKAISERESTLARKEAELAALKEDLRSLEASEPAVEHAKELDGTPLQLKLLTQLGFQLVTNRDGMCTGVLVRGHSSGDVRFVEKGNISDFEYTNELWRQAAL